MSLLIDHFALVTADLDAGKSWMSDALGCPPVGGGVHSQMGTHNALWRIGDVYLEVIAIDPAADQPPYPRWFGLDSPDIPTTPRLAAWIARSSALVTDMTRSAHPLGRIMSLYRDDLQWQLTVPDDGMPVQGGVWPHLIVWPEGMTPPGETLTDTGLTVDSFTLAAPEALRDELSTFGALKLFTDVSTAAAPAMSLSVRRADGQVVRFDQ